MVSSPGGKEVGRLSLKVLPDTTEFVPKLKVFVEKVEKQLKIEIPVELDLDSAFDDLKVFQAEVNAQNLKVDVDVELNTRDAFDDLTLALGAMQVVADVNPVNVNMEVDTAGATAHIVEATVAQEALTQGMKQGASTSSQMGRNFALWGPLIIIAAIAISGLVPALAALVPLTGGIVFGIAALALGFKALKKEFKPVIDGFKDMQKPIGKALTAGLDPFVAKFAKVFLPVVEKGLTLFAKFANGIIKDLLAFLSSSRGLELMGQLFAGIATAMKPFGALVVPLVKVFARLSIAALPALTAMGNGLLDVTNKFNHFLATGDASSTITKSMDYLGQVIQIIGKFVGQVFPPLFAAMPTVIALFDGMASVIGDALAALKPVFEFMSKHQTTMAAIGAALTVLIIGFGGFAAAVVVVNAVMAVNPFVALAIVLVAVAAALIYAYKNSETFRDIVNNVFAKVKAFVIPIIQFIGDHWKAFVLGLVIVMAAPLAAIVAAFLFAFPLIKSIATAVWPIIVAAVKIAWQVIQTTIVIAMGIIKATIATISVIVTIITTTFNIIKAIITAVWPYIIGVIRVAWVIISTVIAVGVAYVKLIIATIVVIVGIVRTVFNTIVSVIRGVISVAVGIVRGFISGVVGIIRGISAIVGIVRSAFFGVVNGVRTGVTTVVNKVKSLPGEITGALTGLAGDLYDVGVDMMKGMVNGVKSMAKQLGNAAKDAAKGAVNGVKGFLHIGSPSKLMHQYGVWTIQGMQFGVESQAKNLQRSMTGVMRGVTGPAENAFDPSSVKSVGGNLAAQVGAVVDNTDGGAKEIFLNWDTGRGVMADIASDQLASREFVADQDARMGAGAAA